MAGEEQAEIVGSARDVFRTECVLDVAAVTRITALSDLTHDLVTENPRRLRQRKTNEAGQIHRSHQPRRSGGRWSQVCPDRNRRPGQEGEEDSNDEVSCQATVC